MMTFKQLEAIYWVARLGGFAQAATKLHATQSAISKRVQELSKVPRLQHAPQAAQAAPPTEQPLTA